MKYLVIILIFFIPWKASGQFSKLPTDRQRLLLELSSGYYNVASVGQINLDSSLIAASTYLKMSRTPVILEGFESEFKGNDITWIDERKPDMPKKGLSLLKGLDHVKLTLLIGAYYVFQSGKNSSDADSALLYLLKAKQESEALRSSFWANQTGILISKTYLKQNKVTDAESFTNLVIQNSKSPLDLSTQAKANYYYATYCPFIADLTKGRISRLETASSIYHQLGDHTGDIISLTYQSNLNSASGNFEKAKKLALNAIKLENSIGFPFTQYNEDQVAMYDEFTLNYLQMLEYTEKELDHAVATKEDFGASIFYARMGRAYAGDDWDSPETDYWLRKSVEEAIKNPGFYTGYTTLGALIDRMIHVGQAAEAFNIAKRYFAVFPPQRPYEHMIVSQLLARCNASLNNNNTAEKYYLQALTYAKDPSNAYNLNAEELYRSIGLFYVKLGRYEQARPFITRYLNSPMKTGNFALDAEEALASIDSAAGNFPSAYMHLQNFAKLNNKTFDARMITQRERLKTTYETKAKEQSIKLLKSKAKADQAELQKVGLQRNLTLAGVLTLFLVSGLVYNGYRNKQHSNLLLNAQQKEINDKNTSLEKILTEKDELLFEKDLLLKEVHHRVKNNLHIVMSLLESQSAYLKDNAALGALLESQNRVQAIALIHQKLYSSDNITQVDMQSYIPELIDYLNESLSTASQHIVINQHIEAIFMDVSQAIPVGIIVNETITNAIKYAFPLSNRGEINVSMRYINGLVDLEIADNGVGFPREFDFQKANSLGMNLMKGLINQLKGTYKFNVHNGVNIRIKFALDHISVLS